MRFDGSGTSGDLLADRRYQYGKALAGEGHHAAAAELFAQVIERVADWAPAWFALGEARFGSGDRDGAVAALEEAAARDRDGVLGAPLALAAWNGGRIPASAGESHVRALFDLYAPRFDDHLEKDLGYRGPALLVRAIDDVATPSARFAHALDLGCGTGLMGEALRTRVARLSGVDLSPAMVANARGKAVYDALRVGDIFDVEGILDLRDVFGPGSGPAVGPAGRFDLVTAADVLVYVGDLRPLFDSVARVLAAGGLFAFTAQSAPDGSGVVVGADRRFAHAPDHIADRAAQAGFCVCQIARRSVRRDAGRDVPGLIVVLRYTP